MLFLTKLAKLTGFRLFHNHVSLDFVLSVFEFGTTQFWRVTDKFRLAMFEEAAKEGVDTIFTFVYSKTSDDPFVKKTIQKTWRRSLFRPTILRQARTDETCQ